MGVQDNVSGKKKKYENNNKICKTSTKELIGVFKYFIYKIIPCSSYLCGYFITHLVCSIGEIGFIKAKSTIYAPINSLHNCVFILDLVGLVTSMVTKSKPTDGE